MKRVFINLSAVLVVILGLSGLIFTDSMAAPLNPCELNLNSSACHYQQERGDVGQIIRNVANLLLYVVGVAAVVMIIISGMKYMSSAGYPDRVATAKRTLIYSVVGLMVAMIAYPIVDWTISTLTK